MGKDDKENWVSALQYRWRCKVGSHCEGRAVSDNRYSGDGFRGPVDHRRLEILTKQAELMNE